MCKQTGEGEIQSMIDDNVNILHVNAVAVFAFGLN